MGGAFCFEADERDRTNGISDSSESTTVENQAVSPLRKGLMIKICTWCVKL